ncbi:hypothetical protein E2C01_041053 [Portunus trituberculatus]|uniref:Uncharacterized protein n=1 Tax=Portunus trituberculatus TaxID=210409 RepID=A0A5B7FJ04_PORTR|nr:hypothetical protein [Portunus trituberculatus]
MGSKTRWLVRSGNTGFLLTRSQLVAEREATLDVLLPITTYPSMDCTQFYGHRGASLPQEDVE